ncbi:unnamed protein product [Moneuplotes crassus]|uniref:Uncharacterized protein n=1 Tax=Euplotes crassus TaxID=5936 RepID=A0AAD1X5H9_EUPCR|nr:unnamed protein product [Moneuplotes crassus]
MIKAVIIAFSLLFGEPIFSKHYRGFVKIMVLDNFNSELSLPLLSQKNPNTPGATEEPVRRKRNRAKVWYPYDFQKGGVEESKRCLDDDRMRKDEEDQNKVWKNLSDIRGSEARQILEAPSISSPNCKTSEVNEKVSISEIPLFIEKF